MKKYIKLEEDKTIWELKENLNGSDLFYSEHLNCYLIESKDEKAIDIIVNDLVNVIDNYSEKLFELFIYNNQKYIGNDDYRSFWKYRLNSVVDSVKDLNRFGDVIRVNWQLNGITVIKEERKYTRKNLGKYPRSSRSLSKKVNVLFRKKNGTWQGVDFEKKYNLKQLINHDKKSIENLIIRAEIKTARFINKHYKAKNLTESEIDKKLILTKGLLISEISGLSVFKETYKNSHLLEFLESQKNVIDLDNEIIDYVKDLFNVKYY